jgi:hypothetical protein
LFEVYIVVQGGVAMVFHTGIYYTLIRLTPSIAYSFSIILRHYYSTAFSTFSQTNAMHYSLSIILFLSLDSLESHQTDPLLQSCSLSLSLSLSLYVCICKYICI